LQVYHCNKSHLQFRARQRVLLHQYDLVAEALPVVDRKLCAQFDLLVAGHQLRVHAVVPSAGNTHVGVLGLALLDLSLVLLINNA
jgi:hypothetical protein